MMKMPRNFRSRSFWVLISDLSYPREKQGLIAVRTGSEAVSQQAAVMSEMRRRRCIPASLDATYEHGVGWCSWVQGLPPGPQDLGGKERPLERWDANREGGLVECGTET